jgi:hypothetical protein
MQSLNSSNNQFFSPTNKPIDQSAIGVQIPPLSAGKVPIANIPTGTTSSTVPLGDDSRLSNERTPVDGSVTSSKLATNAVTTTKITDGSVTSSKLATTGITAGSYTNVNITVGSDGRITAITNGTAGGGSVGLADLLPDYEERSDTTDFSLTAFTKYSKIVRLNITALTNAVTITLPSSGTAGQIIEVAFMGVNFGNFALNFRQGSTTLASAITQGNMRFIYNSSNQWRHLS